ncbi:hypothetical protein RB595_004201 [Gaeumannomyces hyphopodioides]
MSANRDSHMMESMMADLPTGIFWDPREPIPPEIQQYYRPEIQKRSRFPEAHTPSFNVVGARSINIVNDPAHCTTKPAPKAGQYPTHTVVVPRGCGKPPLCVLVPLSISIEARVVHEVAKVTVTQLYFNDSERPIEKGGYTFPLPSGCAVNAFNCRVGQNRALRGQVKPKEEAAEAFEDALKRQEIAGLVSEATPEIFNVMLGNIPANTKVKVEISFVMELKRHLPGDSSVRLETTSLTIPTSIAPRYGDAPPDAHLDLASEGVSRGLSLRVKIDACETISKVSSPTHEATVERGVHRRVAQTWAELKGALDPGNEAAGDGKGGDVLVMLRTERVELGRDFVLDIQTELGEGQESVLKGILEVHPTHENQAAVMLTIPPRFLLSHTVDTASDARDGGEVIFLADRSGSMGNKMESLKSAMQFFLKGIPVHRKFNVWCFGSSYTSLWPSSVEYTENSLLEALKFVDRDFKPNMGGTELLPAIQAIVAARDNSIRADIIVLTDGEVWRYDETMSFVSEARQKSEGMLRLFALGIGDQVSHALVEGIATSGGGYSEIVPSHALNSWEDRVVAMTQAALTDHLDLRIEIEGVVEKNLEGHEDGHLLPHFIRSPASPRGVNLFQKGHVFLLLNSVSELPRLESVVLRLSSRKTGPHVTSPRFVVSLKGSATKDDIVHTLAVKAILNDLSLESLPSNVGGGTTSSERTKSVGEALGCKFSVISRWTSLFLTEDGSDKPDDQSIGMVKIIPVAVGRAPGMTITGHAPLPQPKAMPWKSSYSGESRGRTLKESYLAYKSSRSHTRANPSPIENFLSQFVTRGPPGSHELGDARSSYDSLEIDEHYSPCVVETLVCSRRSGLAEGSNHGDDYKQFVRGLLQIQNFDGSFDFPGGGWEGLHKVLGTCYHPAIQELKLRCTEEERSTEPRTMLGVPTKAAHTLMVVAVLEKHFQGHADLWQLMAAKARAWTQTEVPAKNLRDLFTAAWLGHLPREWVPGHEKPAQPMLESKVENEAQEPEARMEWAMVSHDLPPAKRTKLGEVPKTMEQHLGVSVSKEVESDDDAVINGREQETASDLAAGPRISTRMEVHTVPTDYV